MATAIDAAALLTYRAAWHARRQGRAHHARGRHGQDDGHRDRRRPSSTAPCRCSAGPAWCQAMPVEKLYREIRALRIYEGATEVQKLIIARAAAARPEEAAERGTIRKIEKAGTPCISTTGIRAARGTAHVDTFARDNLPPADEWPELLLDGPDTRYPARLNCAVGAGRRRGSARPGRTARAALARRRRRPGRDDLRRTGAR